MRVGLGLSEDLPVTDQQRLAHEVEEAGLASLWTNEARGRDGLLVCQAWAQATDRLEVGVGVAPLWTRSAGQLAQAVATLQEASDGRFLLGLGVSHPETMASWHGASYRRPVTAAAETLAVLGTLLDGEVTDHDGEVVTSHRFRLEITPLPARGRVYLAAMGPRMLSLAGEKADGVLLNWSSPATVAEAASRTRAAAARSSQGRAPSRIEVAGYVRMAVADKRDRAREALARQISGYCALPAYAAHFARQGFAGEVEAIKAAYRQRGAPAAAAAVPERMLDRLGWYGTPADDPAPALDRYRQAGLDHLVARVVVADDDPADSVRAVVAGLAGIAS